MKNKSCAIQMIGMTMAVLGPSLGIVAAQTAGDEPGTIGAAFAQLYDDDQANKRGELVVLVVADGFPAAKAGIQLGDVVLKVNGSPVGGRELQKIERKDIRGAVGTTLKLSLLRPANGKEMDVNLTRVAFPMQENPASDLFHYSLKGSWRVERVNFPLPWSPQISYRGLEDLAFAPEFDDTSSPYYHSYLFFWWLEGTVAVTPSQLQSDLSVYFRGLCEQRGRNYHFTPDLSQVSVSYHPDPHGPASFGGSPAQSFRGVVKFYDTHGKVITLQSEVVAAACPQSSHTAVFFGQSQESGDAAIWRRMDAIRDTFQCSRQ